MSLSPTYLLSQKQNIQQSLQKNLWSKNVYNLQILLSKYSFLHIVYYVYSIIIILLTVYYEMDVKSG